MLKFDTGDGAKAAGEAFCDSGAMAVGVAWGVFFGEASGSAGGASAGGVASASILQGQVYDGEKRN